jgi:inhibitor of KinA
MPEIPGHTIFPLGDCAVTIDFGNIISESLNDRVLSLFCDIKARPLAGMTEAVPAYSSLTVYYDVVEISKRLNGSRTAFDFMRDELTKRLQQSLPGPAVSSNLVRIPVCYDKEFAPDLEWMAREKKLSTDELVRIHIGRQYRVFMLGFLPGFSYMGEVDERISIPRKIRPVMVDAGSVGIAGRQTGVYPFACPGGWQIIGRTPVQLFDPEKEGLTLLGAGDRVEFFSISKHEFENH